MDDEPSVEIRGEGLEGIWINGQPVGKLLDSANRRISELESELEELRHGEEQGISPEVRNRLLEIHQDWIDVREGRLARFDSAANARRAARLFRRFIQRVDGDSDAATGVKASYGKFLLSREEARRIIAREDTLPTSGETVTIRRTFREAVRRSRPGGCDCEWQECDHALFKFRKPDSYQLVVGQQELIDYCESVQELLEEFDGTDDRRDPTTADDARDRAEDAVDQLETLESAYTVVSSSDDQPLAATNGGRDNS